MEWTTGLLLSLSLNGTLLLARKSPIVPQVLIMFWFLLESVSSCSVIRAVFLFTQHHCRQHFHVRHIWHLATYHHKTLQLLHHRLQILRNFPSCSTVVVQILDNRCKFKDHEACGFIIYKIETSFPKENSFTVLYHFPCDLLSVLVTNY